MMYYTPSQIAEATGLTTRTVRSYLCERFPAHEPESWWRLDHYEYELAVNELRAALKVSGTQPRRVLKRAMSRRSRRVATTARKRTNSV